MLKVLFFGNSGGVFSNRYFGALRETACEVSGVVDVPPARRTSTNVSPRSGAESFVDAARRLGIPVFEPANPNAGGFAEEARKLAPDVFLAAGYLSRLKEELLGIPRVVAANFHASLLPAYRGKHPVFWALRNGERWSGMTVHAMDPGLDTGDILFQVRVRTRRSDSVSSLYDRIMERGMPLVRRLVDCAAKGSIPRRRQAEGGASYHGAMCESDFRLDWSRDSRMLERWITVSPGQCFADIAGRRMFFLDARSARRSSGASPGRIMSLGPALCVIATGGGALRIGRVRTAEGVLAASDAFRALGLREGSALA